jgi:hypothetical protein
MGTGSLFWLIQFFGMNVNGYANVINFPNRILEFTTTAITFGF